MKAALFSVFQKLFIFGAIFICAQLSRELLVRPLIVQTIGPFKVEKHFYIDDSFSSEETQLIKSAINQWNHETHDITNLTIVEEVTAAEFATLNDPKAISVLRMNSWKPFIQSVEEDMGRILGLYTKRFGNPIIVIVPNRIEDRLEWRATTMHEIGHALGLEHNPRKWTLMYPSEDYGAYSITNDDIRNFCLIYFCNPKKLSHQ